jgi:hypothetical protein
VIAILISFFFYYDVLQNLAGNMMSIVSYLYEWHFIYLFIYFYTYGTQVIHDTI